MDLTFKTGINWAKQVIALVLMCLMFGFSAMAQDNSNKPLDEDGMTALVDELTNGLSDLIEDEDQVTAITDKWDAREDLAGKTRKQILNLLFADVKSIIKDKKAQDSIWKAWTGETSSALETPTASSQKPATPPVNVPVNKDCVLVSGGKTTGAVRWFDSEKGYGFITSEAGEDIYVHFSSIQSRGIRTLMEGAHVEFEICIPPGPNAKRVAINVFVV
jgi:cold shock protein